MTSPHPVPHDPYLYPHQNAHSRYSRHLQEAKLIALAFKVLPHMAQTTYLVMPPTAPDWTGAALLSLCDLQKPPSPPEIS